MSKLERETTPDPAPRSGAQTIVDFLVKRGDRHVFGISGSSSVSVFNALYGSPITYVPTIHESVAVAAADGYARVAGKPATVLLYMVDGVVNSMSNIYNAWHADTPLLLLDLQPWSTGLTGHYGIVGEGDVVDMTRNITRLGAHVPLGSSLQTWLERAERIAAGPPGGPVLLSIPEDVLTGPGVPPIDGRAGRRVAPAAPDLTEVTAALAAAQKPLILAGSQIHHFGGSAALVALAEQLHAPVAGDWLFSAQMPIGPGNPFYVGPIWSPAGRAAEQDADVVISVGGRLAQADHAPTTVMFPNARFIAHVSADPATLEGVTNAHWTCACSPGAFLEGLVEEASQTPADPTLTASRRAWLGEAQQRRAAEDVPPWAVALSGALERGWVADETCSLAPVVDRALLGEDGSRFVSASGSSLGWATGAACGVALASGDPVTCTLGDGALRFGAEALWTAKACELPITYVVFDNGGYASTRVYERQYVAQFRPGAQVGYIGSDLRGGPKVSDIFAGFDIPCTTVSGDGDVRAALVEAWNAKGPNALVIDIGFDAGVIP